MNQEQALAGRRRPRCPRTSQKFVVLGRSRPNFYFRLSSSDVLVAVLVLVLDILFLGRPIKIFICCFVLRSPAVELTYDTVIIRKLSDWTSEKKSQKRFFLFYSINDFYWTCLLVWNSFHTRIEKRYLVNIIYRFGPNRLGPETLSNCWL